MGKHYEIIFYFEYFLLFQAIMVFGVLIATTFYYKRHKWTALKNRKIAYKPTRRH